MGALRSAPTGRIKILVTKRLRVTSTSHSEPWGLHPVDALRSAPTGRIKKLIVTQKPPSHFNKSLGALGATPTREENLHKYLRAYLSSWLQLEKLGHEDETQTRKPSARNSSDC